MSLDLGLAAEVVAVDQEQHAPASGVPQQPVRLGDHGERLAGAGRHLDQRPRPVVRQRGLQPGDRVDLRRAERLGDQGWQVPEAVPERRPGRVGLGVAHPPSQRRRPVEREDPARPDDRVEAVGEPGVDHVGLVSERQRRAPRGEPLTSVEIRCVPLRLPVDGAKAHALPLGLDHPDQLRVDVEQVVGAPGRRRHLPDHHPGTGVQVGGRPVLHDPARVGEHPVDDPAHLRLGEQRPAGARRAIDVLLAQRRVDRLGGGGPGVELPLQAVHLRRQLPDQFGEPCLSPDRAQDLLVCLGTRCGFGGGLRGLLVERRLQLDQFRVVPAQQPAQLVERLLLLRACLLDRCRRLRRHERWGNVTPTADRPAEPGSELVASVDQQQRVSLRGVALVHGPVADASDLVEPAAHPFVEKALVTQHLQARVLRSRHVRDAELDERPRNEDLAEQPALEHRSVRIGEQRRLGRRAMHYQHWLVVQ